MDKKILECPNCGVQMISADVEKEIRHQVSSCRSRLRFLMKRKLSTHKFTSEEEKTYILESIDSVFKNSKK